MASQIIEAVATRIRPDEKAALLALPFEGNVADRLRVLVRFGLAHPEAVVQWLERFDGQPAEVPEVSVL